MTRLREAEGKKEVRGLEKNYWSFRVLAVGSLCHVLGTALLSEATIVITTLHEA